MKILFYCLLFLLPCGVKALAPADSSFQVKGIVIHKLTRTPVGDVNINIEGLNGKGGISDSTASKSRTSTTLPLKAHRAKPSVYSTPT